MRSLKLVFLSKGFYKETSLAEVKEDDLLIGNHKGCAIRFKSNVFFEDFSLLLKQREGIWSLTSEKNCFITQGLKKLHVGAELKYGDEFLIKSETHSNLEIIKVQVLHDVDYMKQNYEKVIDLMSMEKVRFGGTKNCNIQINDIMLSEEEYILEHKAEKANLTILKSRYGLSLNGVKHTNKEMNEIILKNHDFIEIVDYFFYYKNGCLYTSKDIPMSISDLSSKLVLSSSTAYDYPKFNRSTRIKYKLPDDEIDILPPKALAKEPRKKLLFTLIPTLVMLAVTIVLRGFLGGGGTFVIFSAISMTMGMIMSVTTYFSDKKQYVQDVIDREMRYREYIDHKENEIVALREKERQVREYSSLLTEDLVSLVEEFDSRLFERTIKDEDFLTLSLGRASQKSYCPVKYNKIEYKDIDDPLQGIPEQVSKKFQYLNNIPLTISLRDAGCIGILGNNRDVLESIKRLTLDISTRQFYNETNIYYILNGGSESLMMWLKWLPHVQNKEIPIRNIAADLESRNLIIEHLYTLLSYRSQQENQEFDKHLVVFVQDLEMVVNHPISKYFDRAQSLGCSFIFSSSNQEFLPQNCKYILDFNHSANKGLLIDSEDGMDKLEFDYKDLDDQTMLGISEKLAAVEVPEVSLESELRQSISFFELFNIVSADDLDLQKSWDSSEVYKSLGVPLGVRRGDELVVLDLNEKHHGPHGLVAGTTGSGKSEILQSYILAMAITYHPHDVAFMIIDFKGGGMANQFEKLPHLLGTITNIDGREINRSLRSIKAELRKRQEMLTSQGLNHVDAYIKLSKKDASLKKMPHLIIVVDEFAELKSEFPDFMKELISAARIGRSLGVHLILATQKPAGVVDNQIWSNSKFKLCLKVQTKEDSNEVIKTPLAAEIVQPGRAYMQVGNNEIFELFQSAYSGASMDERIDEKSAEFQLYELNEFGYRKMIYSNKQVKQKQESQSQLQHVVDYVSQEANKQNVFSLQNICLQPLQDKLLYKELDKSFVGSLDIQVPVGIVDDPDLQSQSTWYCNLTSDNTYIVGSVATGKTTVLQTIIYGLLLKYSPLDVNLYVIDCGNLSLSAFKESPHVGGIVFPQQEEKCKNLFKLLNMQLAMRKERFMSMNVGTHKSYREAGYNDLPQIVLVIDNYMAFKEYYGEHELDLQRLSREGLSSGLSIVCTGNQANVLGYKTLYNFGNRVALNCVDKGEYSTLFDRCRMEPKEVEGRALVRSDKNVLEMQVALATHAELEVDRNKELLEFSKEQALKHKDIRAISIPEMPTLLTTSNMHQYVSHENMKPYLFPIGMNYDSVSFELLDLTQLELLLVSGKPQSGKTNFVKTLAQWLQKNIMIHYTYMYVVDSQERQLKAISSLGLVKEYVSSTVDGEFVLDEIYGLVEERVQEIQDNEDVLEIKSTYEKWPLIALVIGDQSMVNHFAKDAKYSDKIAFILKHAKKSKVFVLISNFENVTVGFSAPELIKKLRDYKRAIIFDDASNIKLMEISGKQQRELVHPMNVGDALFFNNNEVHRLKTVLSEEL